MKNNVFKNLVFSVWFIIFLFIVACFLLYLVFLDLPRWDKSPVAVPLSSRLVNSQIESSEQANPVVPVAGIVVDKFRAEVAADVVVPSVAAQLSPEQKAEAKTKDIAIPSVVVPAAPGASSQFRNFQINAVGGAFSPAKVIVNQGDTVHLNFTAVDGDYDLFFPSYNMSQRAKQGQSKVLEFQAVSEGDFIYYCVACGGPDRGPLGHVIVVPES